MTTLFICQEFVEYYYSEGSSALNVSYFPNLAKLFLILKCWTLKKILHRIWNSPLNLRDSTENLRFDGESRLSMEKSQNELITFTSMKNDFSIESPDSPSNLKLSVESGRFNGEFQIRWRIFWSN